MNKEEYLKNLDSLNLDKNRYCIISGGIMLLYGLKESTEDIDIKVKPDYFEELKERFEFKKSPKYPYLYELSDTVEVAVLDFDLEDIEIVDGYPVESLELQLTWMLEHKRKKDKEKIKIIRDFLNKRNPHRAKSPEEINMEIDENHPNMKPSLKASLALMELSLQNSRAYSESLADTEEYIRKHEELFEAQADAIYKAGVSYEKGGHVFIKK